MAVRIEVLQDGQARRYLDELSRLRLTVFAEWPYLYVGDAASEADYLSTFAAAQDSMIVAAFDGARMVGAATAAPLSGHTDAFVPLFKARGYDPAHVFYCGESVLLADYRGQKIGHAFFDHREAHALLLNARGGRFRYVTFCGVVRDPDDPRKPDGYRPLDGFWRKRGYVPVEGLTGSYDWREAGAAGESAHVMQFWIKAL